MTGSQFIFRVKLDNKKYIQHAPSLASNGEAAIRLTRKTHKKSREGCIACKKRRKKCDEAKPSCSRCVEHKVNCVYPAAKANRCASLPQKPMISTSKWPGVRAPPVLTDTSPSGASHYTSHDLMLLDHFVQNVGIVSAGPEYSFAFVPAVLNIAKEVPFLMHAILALSACHLGHFVPDARMYLIPEALHTKLASKGLQKAIIKMESAWDMDSVFTSSMLLNCLSFCYNGWQDEDLQNNQPSWRWLRIQLGLKDLIIATRPFHAESIWLPMFMATKACTVDGSSTNNLDDRIAEYCGISLASSPEESVYVGFYQRLVPIITRPPNLKFMRLYADAIGSIDYSFVELLEKKDLKALVLFANWMALMCGIARGWIIENLRKECWKVCKVLDANLKVGEKVLMEQPARYCGYKIMETAN